MDDKEISGRVLMSELLLQARHDIAAGQVSEWIREALPLERLEEAAARVDLKTSAANELLAIAVALHRATQEENSASKNAPKPSSLRSELEKIKTATIKLRNMLGTASEAARGYCSAPPLEEPIEGSDGIRVEFDDDPFAKHTQNLDDLLDVLSKAVVPKGTTGPPKSPKYLALLLLGRRLEAEHGAPQRKHLYILATEVLDPLLDSVSPEDGNRWRELISEVLDELNASSRG